MKVRRFLLVVWLMIAFSVMIQAQTYDQLWKKVYKLADEDDLPKSALVETRRIYDKAKAEHNVPQMMDAYFMMMSFRGYISPDSIPMDVKELEAWAESPEWEAHEKAVLYSVLGGVHINKDFEKGDHYLKLSLKDSLTLIDYPTSKMKPLVRSYASVGDNLLHFLAGRAIELWERNQWGTEANKARQAISQTYQMLARQYERKGNRAAWILTALDAYPDASEEQLRQWIAEYGDLDVCAELYLRLVKKHDLKVAEKVTLLREAIKRYPNYDRINALKSEEEKLTSPKLTLRLDAYPDEMVDMTIDYRELKGFILKIYRLDFPVLKDLPAQEIKKFGKLFRQEHITLLPTPDFGIKRMQKKLKALPAGVYYWEAVPDGHKKVVDGNLLNVTALGFIYQELYDNLRIRTVERKSGRPVSNAQVVIYEEKKGRFIPKDTLMSNGKGGLLLKKTKGYYQVRTARDSAMYPEYVWISKSSQKGYERQINVRLFTDRSIYRPGQEMHYSGMVYGQFRDSVQTLQGLTYHVELLDANNQKVASQEVNTDEFGTFNGTFELPRTGKMGNYLLRVNKGIVAFRVEAYKRPTFEVTFDTVRTSYQAGDSILVKGKVHTFAGVPVQGAKVKYRVSEKERSFWRIPNSGGVVKKEEGEAVTDAEGCFEVPVHFRESVVKKTFWINDYEIVADVTNLAGETQNGELVLPLSSSSLLLDTDWKNNNVKTLLKEERKTLKFEVTNLQNFLINTKVDYQVYVEEKDSQGKTFLGDCVLKAKTSSNQSFVPEALYGLPSGTYRLKASVSDEKGRENEVEHSFVLFSDKDKQIPCDEPLWVYQPQAEFDEKGEAVFYYGSREKDVALIFDSFSGNRSLGVKCVDFSDSLLTYRCKYKEEWGDGLKVILAFMKNGKFHIHTVEIRKPKPNKKLELKWKTFRDKLQPGSKERWTLRVLRPNGTPADARLLATMYDASLDALQPHGWGFQLNFERKLFGSHWSYKSPSPSAAGFYFPGKRFPYENLYWFGYMSEPYEWPIVTVGYGGGGKANKKLESMSFTGSVRQNYVEVSFEEEMTLACEADMNDALAEPSIVSSPRPQVKFRENFAETAFFYPQLRTDANGEVDIEFTLPESLTEWKFMGMAHTQDMFYGNITEKVVASKEFMLQPNLPRFVRVGDQVTLAASLVNVSDKEVKGMVKLELFVPETEKVVLMQERPFEVKANETEKISFSFEATDEHKGLAVRMVADGDTFSDGEQRYLPILSNKQKLTESVLLNAHGKGTFTYSLESLFNHRSKSVTRPQMWVEFTGNPLWYAVQSLKAVSNPENDNVLSWASAYYANALLVHLAKAEPRIADSLKVDDMDTRLMEAVLRMKDLQNPDGSWSWFKGMSGSRYMTISVIQLLARLQQMTGSLTDAEVVKMYQQAWAYLNKEMQEEVRWMKEAEKKGAKHVEPSEAALQCLYADALNKQGLSLDVRRYLIVKLEKMSSDLTIYGKALSAIVLQNAGKVDKADKFIQSLMEYSVTDEEMGRYFDSPKAHYSWFSYRIPTQVAAIEALSTMKKDTEDIELMKQWLLKQKQAQAWETPVATTDAVYALLTTGEDWLAHTGEGEIRIGEEKIHIREGESLNYINRKIQGDVMDIRKVTLKKKTAGIGWGVVYAEFEEDMDRVKIQGNALKVSRSIERDGKPLSEGEVLKVGDRLTVRLMVSVDRDMDFVQVKDERAACMEPLDALSGYRWRNGIDYYQETKDSSMSFYLDKMRKGTYGLTYDVYVTSSGVYQQGIATIRSVYAPEFGGHSEGGRLMVK